jgi:hypothetical protein
MHKNKYKNPFETIRTSSAAKTTEEGEGADVAETEAF